MVRMPEIFSKSENCLKFHNSVSNYHSFKFFFTFIIETTGAIYISIYFISDFINFQFFTCGNYSGSFAIDLSNGALMLFIFFCPLDEFIWKTLN